MPAQAGIQCGAWYCAAAILGPGLRRDDDVLRRGDKFHDSGCGHFVLNRQEQIVWMIRHLLKSVLLVEIDCGMLRIDNEPDTANFFGNTRNSIDRIEEHKLPDSLALMVLGGSQPPQTKNRQLVRHPFPILGGEIDRNEFSEVDRVETKHFRTGFVCNSHEG